MPYFRDQVVRELTSLYELLVRMYLPDDAIRYPPPGGWPHIDGKRFAFMEKAETVIDLMRHIPYIRQERHLDAFLVYPGVICNDYSGNHFEQSATKHKDPGLFEPMEDHKLSPSHIAIGRPSVSDDGYFIFINTKDGSVRRDDFVVGIHETFADVTELCKSMKEEFLALRCIPMDTETIDGDSGRFPLHESTAEVKDAYQRHGWPSATFQKAQCAVEVAETMYNYRGSY
ncbi:Hypothetical predicted protein [Lecanosticta acicola]|uniref:Uncharacterized protein n=1 Tax=Lecanosticta acicola TaxID=111012 RepID=A0AAI8Z6Q8_9PEZI|nr:Hypothetical predicted protein [Lecanosticta acicola]